MESKAGQLAALLQDKQVFHVTVERPDGKGSITEETIRGTRGLTVFVEGAAVSFQSKSKTVSFTMLEYAEIITKTVDNVFIITTLADNGGLQIKCRL
jgi:NADH:ubiquinone oxidoreductase subunit D